MASQFDDNFHNEEGIEQIVVTPTKSTEGSTRLQPTHPEWNFEWSPVPRTNSAARKHLHRKMSTEKSFRPPSSSAFGESDDDDEWRSATESELAENDVNQQQPDSPNVSKRSSGWRRLKNQIIVVATGGHLKTPDPPKPKLLTDRALSKLSDSPHDLFEEDSMRDGVFNVDDSIRNDIDNDSDDDGGGGGGGGDDLEKSYKNLTQSTSDTTAYLSSDNLSTHQQQRQRQITDSERELMEWASKSLASVDLANDTDLLYRNDEKESSTWLVAYRQRKNKIICLLVVLVVVMLLCGTTLTVTGASWHANTSTTGATTGPMQDADDQDVTASETREKQPAGALPTNDNISSGAPPIGPPTMSPGTTTSTIQFTTSDGWTFMNEAINGVGHHNSHQSVAISDDGSVVASVVNNKLTFFRSTTTANGSIWKKSDGPTIDEDVVAASFNAAGTRLAIASVKGVDSGGGGGGGHVRVLHFVENQRQWLWLGQKVPFPFSHQYRTTAISLSKDGTMLACGWPGEMDNRGAVVVMRYNTDTMWWFPVGDVLDGDASGDLFGASVAINQDGTLLAIGIPGKDVNNNQEDTGAVRVFRLQTSTWVQVGSDVVGQHSGEQFGYSVALSSTGTRMAVGVSHYTEASYIFELSFATVTWVLLGLPIERREHIDSDESRISVSLSGDGNMLAMGSPEGNRCNVYSFEYGSWTLLGEFSGDAFMYGVSVSLSTDGGTVAIAGGHTELQSFVQVVQRSDPL